MWRRKKEGKKRRKCYHNIFTILSQLILSGRLLLVNIDEKKIIFLEREKNNFNSMFKLKSVSIYQNDFL